MVCVLLGKFVTITREAVTVSWGGDVHDVISTMMTSSCRESGRVLGFSQVMPYSLGMKTPLSNFEAGLEYTVQAQKNPKILHVKT